MTDIKSLLPQMMEAAERASERDWSEPGFTQLELLYIALASPSNILALCNAYIALEERAEKAEREVAKLRRIMSTPTTGA